MNKILTKHFVLNEYLWERDENKLFESFDLLVLYRELEERRIIYKKAIDIQKKSLDDMIKNQDEKGVLERDMMVCKNENNQVVNEKINDEDSLKSFE